MSLTKEQKKSIFIMMGNSTLDKKIEHCMNTIFEIVESSDSIMDKAIIVNRIEEKVNKLVTSLDGEIVFRYVSTDK